MTDNTEFFYPDGRPRNISFRMSAKRDKTKTPVVQVGPMNGGGASLGAMQRPIKEVYRLAVDKVMALSGRSGDEKLFKQMMQAFPVWAKHYRLTLATVQCAALYQDGKHITTYVQP